MILNGIIILADKFLYPSKINITIVFEHANVLQIQGISCKKTDNFLTFWAPFDP